MTQTQSCVSPKLCLYPYNYRTPAVLSGTILLAAKTQEGQFSPNPCPDGDQIPVGRMTAQSNETKIDLKENEARPKVSRSRGGFKMVRGGHSEWCI